MPSETNIRKSIELADAWLVYMQKNTKDYTDAAVQTVEKHRESLFKQLQIIHNPHARHSGM